MFFQNWRGRIISHKPPKTTHQMWVAYSSLWRGGRKLFVPARHKRMLAEIKFTIVWYWRWKKMWNVNNNNSGLFYIFKTQAHVHKYFLSFSGTLPRTRNDGRTINKICLLKSTTKGCVAGTFLPRQEGGGYRENRHTWQNLNDHHSKVQHDSKERNHWLRMWELIEVVRLLQLDFKSR